MAKKGNKSKIKKDKAIAGILTALVVCAAVVVVIVLLSRAARRAEEAAAAEARDAAAAEAAAEAYAETKEEKEAVLEEYSESDGTILYNGQYYQAREDVSAILAMGIDDEELTESETYRNNSQADFLLLAVFDHENKTCTLLQINRDTMTEVPMLGVLGDYIGMTTEQIALAHTYGSGLEDSCENTVDAVSRLLYGVQIDDYFSLTMDSIFVLNDLLGGVTVTIEDDFTGVDSTLVMGETVTLLGEHAENFVRARIAMTEGNTNIDRMRRQRAYLTALAEQLKETVAEDPSFVTTAYKAVKDYLVTNLGLAKIISYASRVINYEVTGIIVPEGESVEGEEFMEFYVDEDALQQTVIDLFYAPVEE